MPLLLPQNRWATWLEPVTPSVQVQTLTIPSDLYRALHAYPADKAVSNVRNDSPELILPPVTPA